MKFSIIKYYKEKRKEKDVSLEVQPKDSWPRNLYLAKKNLHQTVVFNGKCGVKKGLLGPLGYKIPKK